MENTLQSTVSLHSTSERSLLPNGDSEGSKRLTGQETPSRWEFSSLAFLNKVSQGYTSLASAQPSKLLSPARTFRKMAQARDVMSRQTPDVECGEGSGGRRLRFRDGVSLPGVGEIRWTTVREYGSKWLRNPKNLALLVWILAVAVSGAILFMVMVGMLNAVIPKKSARNAWFEVNNQILNALFTLMCLYHHPQRFLHLHQLYRWSRRDVVALRKVYCKDGLRKPHEWTHMLVVVILLHFNCFSQYALCGLNWGYKRSERPAIGVAICLAGAIGCAAGAGIYNTLSPLGKDYVDSEEDKLKNMEEGEALEKEQMELSSSVGKRNLYGLLERRRSFAQKDGKLVESPEWQGGVFDCCMDREVAALTTACGFCVFGWNMDRLGFGNRFVHIATFLLICSAPYWIFLLAAGNIDNRYVRQTLTLSGIAVCIFGLLYGGFWRIRMRTTYGLPARTWCCGQPNMTDCTQWLFCSLCSLCQEVRTAEHYSIRDDKFYVKETRSSGESSSPSPGRSPGPSPLGREEAHKSKFDAQANVEMVPPKPVTVEDDRAAAPAAAAHVASPVDSRLEKEELSCSADGQVASPVDSRPEKEQVSQSVACPVDNRPVVDVALPDTSLEKEQLIQPAAETG